MCNVPATDASIADSCATSVRHSEELQESCLAGLCQYTCPNATEIEGTSMPQYSFHFSSGSVDWPGLETKLDTRSEVSGRRRLKSVEARCFPVRFIVQCSSSIYVVQYTFLAEVASASASERSCAHEHICVLHWHTRMPGHGLQCLHLDVCRDNEDSHREDEQDFFELPAEPALCCDGTPCAEREICSRFGDSCGESVSANMTVPNSCQV